MKNGTQRHVLLRDTPSRGGGLRIVLLAALLWSTSLRSAVVTDSFLDAVAQLESSGGRHTIGDGGKAHGTWQMHAAAWRDTTAYRKRRGEAVWSYSYAHDAKVARVYARDYLTLLETQLTRTLRHSPTPEVLYAAYNVGFTRFENLGFALEKAPRTTQAACARLRRLLADSEQGASRMMVRAPAS